jgi:hypothetical protein
LLKAAQLPQRKDRRWEIELAPLSRMQAWGVPEIKVGDALAMLGFTFTGEQGDAVLRVEYLFAAGKVYGLAFVARLNGRRAAAQSRHGTAASCWLGAWPGRCRRGRVPVKIWSRPCAAPALPAAC